MNNEDKFMQKLAQEFPDMFPNGTTECYSGVPNGWEDIVYNLCVCIDDYVKNSYRCKRKTDLMSRFKFLKYDIWKPFERKIIGLIDSRKPFRDERGMCIFTKDTQAKLENTWRYKLEKKVYKFGSKFFKIPNEYDRIYPSKITVAQIKEKFGTLRFYYDGGDDEISGMVRLTEYLSSKICQKTGKPGNLCIRGGWWATLCDEEAKKLGYTQINATGN